MTRTLIQKKIIPKSNKKLYTLVRNTMALIQEDYTLDFPRTAKIVAELKRQDYTITKTDNKRIIATRKDIKYDINYPKEYGFTQ